MDDCSKVANITIQWPNTRGGTGREFRRIPDPGIRPLLPGRIRVVAGSGYLIYDVWLTVLLCGTPGYLMKLKCRPSWSVCAVVALRCGKAVQMHNQFVVMHCHCQLHCL